jgi:uncharacterized membrane protein YeaQ/YmgE (transglycosylase-associated protein family)
MLPGGTDLAGLFELAGVASLCTWTAALVVGMGVCSPERALLTGIPGTLLGPLVFRQFGWPTGPTLGGHPIVPAFVGTAFLLVAAAYVHRLQEAVAERRARTPAHCPLKDWGPPVGPPG